MNTILLAEDSPDDAMLFQVALRKARVANQFMVVQDGDMAISYLKGESVYRDRARYPLPSVLFLDLKMPRGSGFKVLEWLTTRPQLREQMLVVVLSHWEEVRQIRRAYELGADSFLIKPILQEDLERLIEGFEGYWMRSPISGPEGRK